MGKAERARQFTLCGGHGASAPLPTLRNFIVATTGGSAGNSDCRHGPDYSALLTSLMRGSAASIRPR